MLVVRPLAIVEDCIKGGQVGAIWLEPCVNVLWPDRNDAAIVPSGRDLRRRLVRDRCEREQLWLVGPGRRNPPRPMTCDQHVLRGLRPELEDRAGAIAIDIFVERRDGQNSVRNAKRPAPKSDLQIVFSSIV